jgi:hypothetical protein
MERCQEKAARNRSPPIELNRPVASTLDHVTVGPIKRRMPFMAQQDMTEGAGFEQFA